MKKYFNKKKTNASKSAGLENRAKFGWKRSILKHFFIILSTFKFDTIQNRINKKQQTGELRVGNRRE